MQKKGKITGRSLWRRTAIVEKITLQLGKKTFRNVQNFQVVSGTEGIQVRDELTRLLVDWTAVVESCNAETSYVQLMRLLQPRGILKDDNSTTSFFRVCTEICVQAYINGGADNSNYKTIDAFAKLIVLVIKFQFSSVNV